MSAPISSKAKSGSPTFFFVLFGSFGFVFLCFFFLRPVFKIIDARNWNATPCVIVSSSVGRHLGSKGGSTYSVDLVYSYNVGWQQFTARRYHFLGGSSSGYAGKAAIVARFPRGMKTICFVNPHDPADAVIERGFTPDMWFGLIPLAFIGVAVGGLVFSRRAANRPPTAQWQPAALRHIADFTAISAAPREIKSSASPFGKFAGVAMMALFWNGFVAFFLFQVFKNAHFSHGDWASALFNGGQSLFMVPFVLVGIGLLVAVVYQLLALFNPRIHLTLDPGAVALGETLAVNWKMTGRVDALARFRISLEGREEATYQAGKNMSVAKSIFFNDELVNTTSRADFAAGQTRVELPRNAMHSLDTGHNKIVWTLGVQGEIPRWPDVKEEYPIIVTPMRKEALK